MELIASNLSFAPKKIKMTLTPILYSDYEKDLPQSGNHILAQERNDNLIVYQAFRPAIAESALEHQKFGGPHYSFSRMSWIKPNFLWMMYRSGWAAKEGQEYVLAIEISKQHFLEIIEKAVHSTFQPSIYQSKEAWKKCLLDSEVRLQWDPDHDPYGKKLERRAIQLGLSGEILNRFATEWIVSIEDVSDFARKQSKLLDVSELEKLMVIQENMLEINNLQLRQKLLLS